MFLNIVLLSGGSGTRLWPLSNDVRSKQFIRLFKNEVGEYESMVQRIFRQITAVHEDVKLTIAASKSQVSAIRNQLGDKVTICVEPFRRDTFPAIALAAAYLKDALSVPEDECIIICPVDPFVENTYFEAIKELEKHVMENTANLILMGIEPTYPSDKYGYIIPETTDAVSKVREFKEKPDTATAREYLKQGALWNAGVFAFRLGYMLKRAHSMLDFTDYTDLYANYGSVEKISFDYAVVEKEASIQVVRYAGEWKDVGTWNMMAEVMSDAAKGNVILDEKCIDTHVVNELNIPVLCMGCKNMVIAVSNDGILVSDKERSGYMKPYVEKISDGARYAEKSWGTYTVIDTQPGSLTVRIDLREGSRMKYHFHHHRDEIWTIVSGRGNVVVNGTEQAVQSGDTVRMPAGIKHTLIADTNMSVIEVQVGPEISKSDKEIIMRKEEEKTL